MENYVIIGILAVIILLAVHATVKRFREKRSCCSGGAYKARRKKLKTVAGEKTFLVEGMHCQNCINRVMEAVNDIPEASAAVNLRKHTVTVSMEKVLDDSVLIGAIEKGGYKVTGVQ